MEKFIREKIDGKVRDYLKKQFPKRKLIKLDRLPSTEGDIFGINSMQIRVWDEKDAVYYKLIKTAK